MMGKKNKYNEEFKYGIKDIPWPAWVCFAIGIICLLLIIFFTPPKFDIVAGICSIAGFFGGLSMGTLDYTNRTVVKKIDEHFESTSSEHHKMVEVFGKMMEALEKIISFRSKNR